PILGRQVLAGREEHLLGKLRREEPPAGPLAQLLAERSHLGVRRDVILHPVVVHLSLPLLLGLGLLALSLHLLVGALLLRFLLVLRLLLLRGAVLRLLARLVLLRAR